MHLRWAQSGDIIWNSWRRVLTASIGKEMGDGSSAFAAIISSWFVCALRNLALEIIEDKACCAEASEAEGVDGTAQILAFSASAVSRSPT